MSEIRNFSIIAHIDHGKSTLADRLLELTKTVETRKMKNQVLDQMDLERERGITIKLQPVRMRWALPENLQKDTGQTEVVLNLIDTPGHVDFTYEVSRSLAAVEGAVLLVDATKGVQAQTVANLQLAQAQNLVIIPVINKIDLPNARPEAVAEEIAVLLNIDPDDVLRISAKAGTNIEKVLERVVQRVPAPKTKEDAPLQALIFDSSFDTYKGVVAFIRIMQGQLDKGQRVKIKATKTEADALEIGYFFPELRSQTSIKVGEIGYIATGLKDPTLVRVGDTITTIKNPAESLPGYREPASMVFASFFPEDSDQFDDLRDALDKLLLTDSSLHFEPESSPALGRGFRVGFLGLLHVEIISERLKREFNLDLVISAPSVEYHAILRDRGALIIRSATELPLGAQVEKIEEPMVDLTIIVPTDYMGSVIQLAQDLRSIYKGTDYIRQDLVRLNYEMPLAEIITDFYDRLKSVSSGYASMSYEPSYYRAGDLVRLDILVADEIVGPFSRIVPRSQAQRVGRAIVEKLKDIVPKQLFAVSLQAAIGGQIVARETISAMRKDVTGYLYGGDVTRKKKLLEKQKKGKKRMKASGKVSIPQKVFLEMIRR
ncbi:MAG: elongation factor 4 [Candidatus Yanofskybacteria bacterium CG10_big_fil_rev_8_21_14_0_10_46_23]|uniref:Elongation factor 4 n=1 Tax=Candidatus Yanofskybacteria bacterium CG10_big_fil_rev_8_21_14_0_10_46_23 TaxID=1975098 RepID=A0A2H0R3R7_9BACT|nr:MAG: elongation factor 4 [Candidatus Yanofskybacteria bacterium CG10_big_fil_rev_8_21_14_0_10_46_23]